VDSIRVKDGLAEVTLKLEDAAKPLHEDAHFTIRPVSLLGERYIDMDRGAADSPLLAKGAKIPTSQTGTGVGLDEVLNTVDPDTGDGLSALLTTLGKGMDGNGKNVDEALKALAPSMKDTQALAKVLDEHNELLTRLITNFEPVAEALATRDGQAMDQLVGSSDKVLMAVRERQEKLNKTLAKLPGTLRVLRSTMGNLRSAAKDTAPTLKKLRPLTDKLPEFSNELRAFSDALDPALATSEPVLKEAKRLIVAARPVAADLRTSGPKLAKTTSGTQKLVRDLTANRDALFGFVRNWALSTNGADGISHYFRAQFTLHPDMITGLLTDLSTSKPTDSKSSKAAAPKSGNASAPKSSSGSLLDGLSGTLGNLLSPKGKSATGLDQKQELNLLGLLLGGN
ncbi:MAG: MCE family protein, partial [Nocardioidaceae bacterium]|nr:MCE family protein [Nocardioidaceae bacterium]